MLPVLMLGCASALPPPGQVQKVAGADTDDPAQLYQHVRERLRTLEHEGSQKRRAELAREAVALGERCEHVAPQDAQCAYGLALALGAQAREQPSTAHDGLALMADRLARAEKEDSTIDHAGPARVLALLLTRAPGWPTGPGDPDSGLEHAKDATTREPAYAPNWLALAEAARAVGDGELQREAADRAHELAEADAQRGEDSAQTWLHEAKALRPN